MPGPSNYASEGFSASQPISSAARVFGTSGQNFAPMSSSDGAANIPSLGLMEKQRSASYSTLPSAQNNSLGYSTVNRSLTSKIAARYQSQQQPLVRASADPRNWFLSTGRTNAQNAAGGVGGADSFGKNQQNRNLHGSKSSTGFGAGSVAVGATSQPQFGNQMQSSAGPGAAASRPHAFAKPGPATRAPGPVGGSVAQPFSTRAKTFQDLPPQPMTMEPVPATSGGGGKPVTGWT